MTIHTRFDAPSITRTTPDPSGEVSTILTNGRIWTGDAAGTWASAIAIADGRLVAVGGEDVSNLAVRETKRINLGGKTVIPGLIDSHLHPINAGQKMLTCDLSMAASREEYAELITAYAATLDPGIWLRGGGWSFDAFPGGIPTAAELDELVADRPAVLTNRDGHTYWANTRALKIASIDKNTPDPHDGRIERDADGQPTGALQEGAMALLDAVLPEVTDNELLQALLVAQEHVHSLGITGWQDARVLPSYARIYTRAADEELLTADVTGALWWDRGYSSVGEQIERMLNIRRTMSRSGLRYNATKVMLDGVAENFTAAMLEPYIHECLVHDHGLHFFEPKELLEIVVALDAANQQIHFHAVGDSAVRQALDLIEHAQARNGGRRLRHHIAHIQVVHPTDMPRFTRLGVAANIQPLWARLEPQMTELTMPFLGTRRSTWQYPFGALDRAGAMFSIGSDWPVSTPEPFREIHVAVNRAPAADSPTWTPEEGVFLPHERLTLARTLRAFTSGSAWVNGTDHERGTLEPGKYADFVVLDRDPFTAPSEDIWLTRAEQTWIRGEPVYEV